MISRRHSTACWDHECGMRDSDGNRKTCTPVRIATTMMVGKLGGWQKHWSERTVIATGWMEVVCRKGYHGLFSMSRR